MFITTLPEVTHTAEITRMLNHPLVDGFRYNVGTSSPYSPEETLDWINQANTRNLPFWIDLKGRQLRITLWADPTYGDIIVNHPLSVDLPAKIVFRDRSLNETSIVSVNGNKIFVNPRPKYAVGAGQAVNVIGDHLQINGYLTETDQRYITAAQKLGLHNYMLSFVEDEADLESVLALDPDAQMILKIESQPGLNFVENLDLSSWPNVHLMLARDDLMINIGPNKANILVATQDILNKDPEAIAASHIFCSLSNGLLSPADFSDLAYLSNLGYRHFMLSDTISHNYFNEAVAVWRDFLDWSTSLKEA